jgi:hypothetical protein
MDNSIFVSEDTNVYGDIYATLVFGIQRDNITFVDGHSNYDFIPINHVQTKILCEFIARHIPIYRGVAMNESITPLQNQIPEEMKPSASKLVKELRKYLHEIEDSGYTEVTQLLFDVAQEIEDDLEKRSRTGTRLPQ